MNAPEPPQFVDPFTPPGHRRAVLLPNPKALAYLAGRPVPARRRVDPWWLAAPVVAVLAFAAVVVADRIVDASWRSHGLVWMSLHSDVGR